MYVKHTLKIREVLEVGQDVGVIIYNHISI